MSATLANLILKARAATGGNRELDPLTIKRGLTRAQRMYVKDGCIHGDCTMRTVRALKEKGLFHLVITSPNGRCGFMRLTPLGEQVRALLTALEAKADG